MKNILVTRSSMPDLSEYVEEITPLFESHWLTNMGVKHEQFSMMLKEFLNVDNIDLFTNGHMALELSIQAMNFPSGSEVITTPFTFASTTHAIVRNNLVPVLCDIKETDYTIDESLIESLITDKTVAILPVHVYGNICNVEAIECIAKKHNLSIIYDAAHAFGCKYKGIDIGRFGDISCFSFHATKVFNSIEGGAAVFKDPSLSKKLFHLKNFGIDGIDTVSAVGANAKMNEFCAAMGICNLRHITGEIKKRKHIYELYMLNLNNISGLKTPVIEDYIESNYAYFPIIIDPVHFGASRDYIHNNLSKYGYHSRKYFYPIVSEYSCYKDLLSKSNTPIASKISHEVLTLPYYADINDEDVIDICSIIKSCHV